MTTALFGGSKSTSPIYTGIQVQTSAYGLPIPFGWGRNRRSFNIGWYRDFKKHPANLGGKGGAKGGGSYNYTAATILLLGEGIISSIPNVYMNQDTVTTLAKLGLTLFTGTNTQSPPGYITTNHPTEALSYANTAYLFSSALGLGSSAAVPSLAFEAIMALSGTMPGTDDANMADIIPDFLTNSRYGMGLTSGNIDSASLAFFKSYTQAQGLFFSPVLEQPEKATEILQRWAQLSNTWIFWSGTSIKFVPLGDEALSANSATYTPNTTVAYDLAGSDFIAPAGTNPIRVNIMDPVDAQNWTVLTFSDRSIQYNQNTAEYKDQTLVAQFGKFDETDVQATEICEASIAQIAADLIGKRNAYIRTTYSFTLSFRFVLLEPGDLCTITHPFLASINMLPVRIVSIDENDEGNLDIVAEEYPGTLGVYRQSDQQQAQGGGGGLDQFADPGDVNEPCIFEPNSALAGQPAQAWIAVSGGANWGGAKIYISLDGGSTFQPIGSVSAAAKQGPLTADLPSHADPDNTNTLSVDLAESEGILQPVTHADADAFRTLSYLAAASIAGVVPNVGELTAYGDVSSTGTYTDDLTYLRRALYGTAAALHSTGANFTLLDIAGNTGSLFKYALPAEYIGETIHVKFCSFNLVGDNPQDLSDVIDYEYTVLGTGFGGGAGGVPTTPTGLTVAPTSGQSLVTWNPNPATDNVTSYEVFRGTGTGTAFGSCTQVFAGLVTSWMDTDVVSGQAYTYYLVATNGVGDSSPEGPANATSSTVTYPFRLVGGTPGRKPLASEELFNVPMLSGDTLPVSLTGSLLECEIAPTSNWVLTLYQNGVSIGTGTILAGNTTGTFTFASQVTFATDDSWSASCPAIQDATCSGVAFRFVGTETQ